MTIENQPLHGLKWVDRDSLQANDYNPNHVAPKEMELLRVSILESGWTQPIVVLSDGKTIVDGFHRWTLSGEDEIRKMTDGKVPVVSCGMDDAHRVLATVRHNRARGVHGIDPMAQIVRRLKSEGLDDKEIMKRCGMEKEEIDRLMEVKGLPESVGEGKEFNDGWYQTTRRPRVVKKSATGSKAEA